MLTTGLFYCIVQVEYKMTNGHKGGAVMNMVAFGKKVVKFRIPILIISILLLIPAGLGYVNTRVNYDVLTYLPEDIETMQGQDILVKDFGTGAFSMFIVDGMEDKEVSALKAKIENVEHVQKVLWYDSLADISMPKSMIPKDVYEVFNSDTGTMMAIFLTRVLHLTERWKPLGRSVNWQENSAF